MGGRPALLAVLQFRALRVRLLVGARLPSAGIAPSLVNRRRRPSTGRYGDNDTPTLGAAVAGDGDGHANATATVLPLPFRRPRSRSATLNRDSDGHLRLDVPASAAALCPAADLLHLDLVLGPAPNAVTVRPRPHHARLVLVQEADGVS